MDDTGAGTGENEIGSFSGTNFTITKNATEITITSVGTQEETAIIQIVDHTVLRLKAVADDDSVSQPLEIDIENIDNTYIHIELTS
jgi:hypothetical protein